MNCNGGIIPRWEWRQRSSASTPVTRPVRSAIWGW
jgi:hypothetical protein